MMEQYRSIKQALPPDTILFYRLGDFYEMFFEDAVRASDILNITLTGREGGAAGRVPMCGFPHHAFQQYVRDLLDENLKVAICDQVGDPKASKGLVERKVTRIITPATYLDEEKKEARAEYMVAIARHDDLAALACLELSTGEYFVREFPADRLKSELSLLEPRELIVAESLKQDEALLNFIKDTLKASVTVYEDWIFGADEGLRQLKDTFNLASERSIDFAEKLACVSVAGTILYYLKDHFHSTLQHIQIPKELDTSDFMILDHQTQRSLELINNMNGNRKVTLLATIDQTRTLMGARALQQWVTQPLLDLARIQARLDAVAELVDSEATMQELVTLLGGVKDIERTLSRLNYGVANARDLLNLKLFLEKVPELQRTLQPRKAEFLLNIFSTLIPFPNLTELIEQAIEAEPPITVRDGGMIKDGYSRDLDDLRSISRNGKSWILGFQKREVERTGIKGLKVKYSGVFGYTIEVSKSYLNMVPEEYTRRQTLANAERFLVPELKEWDQKISGAEDKIKGLEYALFTGVREKVLEELEPLQVMAKAIGGLDAIVSLARIASAKKWVRPEVTNNKELMIKAGRHPVVEAMLSYGEFVSNDTFLDTEKNQLAVLTGPNMAGKSTYIRQVAQLVLLAQIGSFVPAAFARIGLVDRIFTRIGASDNLAGGESTFMVEMIETAHILRNATERSLLILDEVGRGTSTFDGVSIAWAICEHLAKGQVRPRTLFATHYHELTQLEAHFEGIRNYNITVKEKKDGIVFLRKVVEGGSDRSYGIHVARLAGIPKEVTERAGEILNILESENTEATRIIEGEEDRKRADKQQEQLTFFSPNTRPQTEADPVASEIIEALKAADPNQMTPMQALALISELQSKAREHKEKEA